MLQLTSSEVSSLPADTKVYEGVGKMYVYCVPVTRRRCPHQLLRSAWLTMCYRFVMTPIPDVQKRLQAESEALTKEMSNLDKKEDYLEKTYTNSKNSIEQVLKGAN
jgi:prefoldin subunit 1